MKRLSLIVVVSLLIGMSLSGCTQTTNPAYKNFQKSPCACLKYGGKNASSKS